MTRCMRLITPMPERVLVHRGDRHRSTLTLQRSLRALPN